MAPSSPCRPVRCAMMVVIVAMSVWTFVIICFSYVNTQGSKPTTHSKDLCGRIAEGNTMALFAEGGPDQQAEVDLFSKDFPWVTNFAPEIEAHVDGAYFDGWRDPRVKWFLERFNVSGKTGLELGPLEAAHSYMLQKAGVAKVDAIEGDSVHFMKCLVMKNLAELNNVHFHFGDFRLFAGSPEKCKKRGLHTNYDFALAVGVLYHMENPVQLLWDLAVTLKTNYFLLWTHVYSDAPGPHHKKQRGVGAPSDYKHPLDEKRTVHGFEHVLHKYFYATNHKQFLGGALPYAHWLTKEDLIGALKHFGMRVEVNESLSGEHRDTEQGMHITLLAYREQQGQPM